MLGAVRRSPSGAPAAACFAASLRVLMPTHAQAAVCPLSCWVLQVGLCLSALMAGGCSAHELLRPISAPHTGNSGPVLLCLHGGGYTGLSWALIARALKDRQGPGQTAQLPLVGRMAGVHGQPRVCACAACLPAWLRQCLHRRCAGSARACPVGRAGTGWWLLTFAATA